MLRLLSQSPSSLFSERIIQIVGLFLDAYYEKCARTIVFLFRTLRFLLHFLDSTTIFRCSSALALYRVCYFILHFLLVFIIFVKQVVICRSDFRSLPGAQQVSLLVCIWRFEPFDNFLRSLLLLWCCWLGRLNLYLFFYW